MSWNGLALIRLTSTSSVGMPRRSSRRAALSAAQIPGEARTEHENTRAVSHADVLAKDDGSPASGSYPRNP